MAVQERKKVWTIRGDSQFQKGRKYEPTEIDGSARKEESMNNQRCVCRFSWSCLAGVNVPGFTHPSPVLTLAWYVRYKRALTLCKQTSVHSPTCTAQYKILKDSRRSYNLKCSHLLFRSENQADVSVETLTADPVKTLLPVLVVLKNLKKFNFLKSRLKSRLYKKWTQV
jgi:hypothetical protein